MSQVGVQTENVYARSIVLSLLCPHSKLLPPKIFGRPNRCSLDTSLPHNSSEKPVNKQQGIRDRPKRYPVRVNTVTYWIELNTWTLTIASLTAFHRSTPLQSVVCLLPSLGMLRYLCSIYLAGLLKKNVRPSQKCHKHSSATLSVRNWYLKRPITRWWKSGLILDPGPRSGSVPKL